MEQTILAENTNKPLQSSVIIQWTHSHV